MSPICSGCEHWYLGRERSCAAFPSRRAIPLDIWFGRNAHTSPVPGDHGIQFEPLGSGDRDDLPPDPAFEQVVAEMRAKGLLPPEGAGPA